MKKSFFITCLCLGPLIFLAQSTMVKGYIVTLKDDTLKGEVKVNPKKQIDNFNKVTFKDETGVQKIYKPNRIKAYGFEEHNFVAMDSEEEMKFYEVIASGAINFYKLGYEGLRMNHVVFEEEYYISVAGEKDLILIKESKFKKQIAELMEDNQELVEEYGEEKKFDLEKALSIITNYNTWKASQ